MHLLLSAEVPHPIKVLSILNSLVISLTNRNLGSRSRAAYDQYGGGQQADDPNQMMLKETGAGVGGIDTMSKNLSKEREYDKIKEQLTEAFSKIDLNRDGSITMDEIIRFLNLQTKGTVDTSIAEQIFQEIDEDGSNKIELAEFVNSYFDKQRLVKERMQELEIDIESHFKAREQLLLKLKEQKQKEHLNSYGLDEDALV